MNAFTYTDNNQMSLIKDFADNRRTRLLYDTASNISRIQSPDGSWVSYTYDALNQLIKEEHSIGIVGTDVLDGPYTSVEYAVTT